MKNEVPVNEHILFVKEMLWALATHGENPLHTNQRIMEAVNGLCHAIVDAFEPEAKGNGDITTPVMGILHWALPAIEAIYEETPEVYPEIRAYGDALAARISDMLGAVACWHKVDGIIPPVAVATHREAKKPRSERRGVYTPF